MPKTAASIYYRPYSSRWCRWPHTRRLTEFGWVCDRNNKTVGIIIGGIAAGILVCFLIWYLFYKFFKNRRSIGSIASGPIAPGQGYFYPGNSNI
jgi:hypothetical protein